MEIVEKTVKTDAKALARQKKYDEKCKQVKIRYTPKDIYEYNRLKKYIEDKNISIAEYLKELIKTDLDKKGY